MLLLRSADTGHWMDYSRKQRRRDARTGTPGTTLWEIAHTFVVAPQLAHTLAADLEELGFEVSSERLIVRRRLTATVRAFLEPDSPEVSDETVAQLVGLARDALGDYRGWRTTVVADLGESAPA